MKDPIISEAMRLLSARQKKKLGKKGRKALSDKMHEGKRNKKNLKAS